MQFYRMAKWRERRISSLFFISAVRKPAQTGLLSSPKTHAPTQSIARNANKQKIYAAKINPQKLAY